MLLGKRTGRRPDFVVIGAMKAGTTTLYGLLRSHPDIFMPAGKELDYFAAELNWRRGQEWYLRQFAADAALCGECSPNYTNWPRWRGVPERMHALIPSARLIFSVREPVARAVSHYKHRLAHGRERRPIDAALGDEIYLRRGRYHAQMQQFLVAGYRREGILVVQAEQLRTRREAVLREILGFLGVADRQLAGGPDLHLSERKRVPGAIGSTLRAMALPVLERLPWSVRKPVERGLMRPFSSPMPPLEPAPATVEAVRAALRDDIARFRRLMGQPLEEWPS